jgi:WD40 repeat protein
VKKCSRVDIFTFLIDIYSVFSEDIGKDGDLYIRSVCFSPDNRFLAAGAEDKTVKVRGLCKYDCLLY